MTYVEHAHTNRVNKKTQYPQNYPYVENSPHGGKIVIDEFGHGPINDGLATPFLSYREHSERLQNAGFHPRSHHW